jgi:hypothetical protein
MVIQWLFDSYSWLFVNSWHNFYKYIIEEKFDIYYVLQAVFLRKLCN